MQTHSFADWLTLLRQQLAAQGHRCLVVLKGDFSWSNKLLLPILQRQTSGELLESSLAYGEEFTAAPELVIDNFQHHLGIENDLVLFADSSFHPDAFAALSGSIKAGGVMFWLCPPELIEEKSNLFIQRFWQQITADSNTLVIEQQERALPKLDAFKANVSESGAAEFTHPDCCNQEQLDAVTAIEKVANGHRNRPLILTADRGRGKSSALAIATANLLKNETNTNSLTILITAPHSDALKVFFTQLQRSCPEGKMSGLSFSYRHHSVKFVAVDNLLQQRPDAQLLLVDEAAGIPVYLLAQFAEYYHRIVFSSTVHGYEGAGRGFSIKFQQLLAAKAPEFKQLHINHPIRWQPNDPLEQLVFRSFLLACYQAERAAEDKLSVSADNITTRMVYQQQLFDDEKLLQQVFNVLISAHYQTTPSDLKLLLNNSSLRIFASFADEQCIAVALTILEGKAEKEAIAQVAQSQKRLRDHFLPQSLYVHANCQQAFEFSYLRVMRIAVVEKFQQQGIGGCLLEEVKQYASQHNIDLLGTSFGVHYQLLRFWRKAQYQVVRLGFSRDKASGEHSALLIQPLNPKGQKFFSQVQQEFYRQFSFLLSQQFQQLPEQLVAEILHQCPKAQVPILSSFDRQVVEHFIECRSLYDNSAYSLHLWLIARLNQGYADIPTTTLALLVRRIIQRQPISEICQYLGFTGKKQVNRALIDAVKLLV